MQFIATLTCIVIKLLRLERIRARCYACGAKPTWEIADYPLCDVCHRRIQNMIDELARVGATPAEILQVLSEEKYQR